jgi:hypothetical protein
MFREMYEREKDEVNEQFRMLHTEEFRRLCRSPNDVIWDMGQNFSEETSRKCPYGRSRSRCENDIKINDREMGSYDGGRMELAEDLVQWRILLP